MRERKIDIEGDGRLEYGTMVLTARHIKLDTDERELYADGDPLVEDSETIAGDRMGYNFRHKTGAVDRAASPPSTATTTWATRSAASRTRP